MRFRIGGMTSLALAILAMTTGIAGSATPVSSPVPPELQALELKMEELQISSERYTRKTGISLTLSEESSSSNCPQSLACHPTKPTKRVSHRRTHFVIEQAGEVNVPQKAAKTSIVHGKYGLRLIVIGLTTYYYLPGTVTPHGRPWVRSKGHEADELFANMFPFHGGLTGEARHGGTGPYAGLIDLLGSAVGGVRIVGPATVDGQASTEFAAVVVPSGPFTDGGSRTDALEVFITEAGLPLRVVQTSTDPSGDVTSNTTDILAVNVPVEVSPPPARLTISQARVEQLSRGRHGNSSSSITSSSAVEVGA